MPRFRVPSTIPFTCSARAETREDRPAPSRDSAEIKALNILARHKLLTAMSNGEVKYDVEKRVLTIAKYTRSE